MYALHTELAFFAHILLTAVEGLLFGSHCSLYSFCRSPPHNKERKQNHKFIYEIFKFALSYYVNSRSGKRFFFPFINAFFLFFFFLPYLEI